VAAQLADIIGDSATAAAFRVRAQSYRNVWNSTRQLMCPRTASGAFACPWDPAAPYPILTGYTEGDALQYQTFVPHDPAGLLSLFPSPEAFVEALQTLQANQVKWPLGTAMPNPWYWAGNEPDILAPWQFPFAGNAYANYTQYWTQWLVQTYYTVAPDGIPGNDDFGTMSAWHVFATFGMYPVTGMGYYILSTPQFSNITIQVPSVASVNSNPLAGTISILAYSANTTADNGKTSLSLATLPSTAPLYVKAAAMNGVLLPTPFLNHSALVAATGAAPFRSTLEFWLAAEPCEWGQWTPPGL
jgi:putative alpha-1,2-mannosidase